MLAFVNISVFTAVYSKKWFGQLQLYTNFLLAGFRPLVLGIISLWVQNKRIKDLFEYSCAGIPLILIFIAIIAYMLGNIEDNWEPNFRFVVYRVM